MGIRELYEFKISFDFFILSPHHTERRTQWLIGGSMIILNSLLCGELCYAHQHISLQELGGNFAVYGKQPLCSSQREV